jgi:hypothetical protein
VHVGGAGTRPTRLIALLALALLVPRSAKAQSVSQTLTISAPSSVTWSQPPADVLFLDGPVRIDIDHARLTADQAVIWLTPQPGGADKGLSVRIALMGSARLEQDLAVRSGDEMLVTASILGSVRVSADQQRQEDLSHTPAYERALLLRDQAAAQTPQQAGGIVLPPLPQTPSTRPAVAPAPVQIRGDISTFRAPDGTLAVLFENNVLLAQQRPGGEYLQLQADRGIAFTTLRMGDDGEGGLAIGRVTSIEQAMTAVYLEGDVRIAFSPAPPRPRSSIATSLEQRLSADRVFYDFTTDQAVLTQAVFRATDPTRQLPLTMRAQVIRQLARTPQTQEFSAENARLTTSSFAVPTYAVAADKVYLRQEDAEGPRDPQRYVFTARDSTFQTFGLPVLWLPVASGSFTERGLPLRHFDIGSSSGYGFGVRTEWGLFESLGRVPPEHLDTSVSLDYFADRGAGLGMDAAYDGGLVTSTTRQPWNFTGDLTAYIVPDDQGVDNLGRDRAKIDPGDEIRGRALWQHQHFFPDHWQLQLQAAWVSDATFMEEWFEREFNTEGPQETSIYFRRAEGPEAITFLTSVQPNEMVTTADMLQEQFEVERLPVIGYDRIGDSLGRDTLTVFGNATLAGLRFRQSVASLADQGFGAASGGPGLPSVGVVPFTDPFLAPMAIDDELVYRADVREQVDYPTQLGPIHAVPYLMGRATAWSDSPEGTGQQRLMGGAGLRVGTAFWRVYDDTESRMLDLHRIRHVVEPELHLFTSAATLDRGEAFIYDESVDGITDLSSASVGLRQRWQTKRGGPGRLRSVDFLSLNLFFNSFSNEPPADQMQPVGFRGLYFASLPEASVPRDSFNADAQWRISDSTVVLADAQQNLEESVLATAAIGLAVQRGDHVSYFIGTRYINELDTMLASIALQYELTRKYSVTLGQSYDFDEDGTVYTSGGIRRRFDRLTAVLTAYHDQREDESGVRFTIYPEGLGVGLGTDTVNSVLGQ